MTRLLHLSDTHLLAPGSASKHPEIDPAAQLGRTLIAAGAEGPFDAVVLTGDIADDGSLEAVQRARELVVPLAPVVAAVPGNHDRTEAVAQVFGTAPVQVGAWQVVGVATNVAGEVAGHGRPAIDALAGCEGPTVLLMHHPARSHSTHPWFTLADAAELEERLRRHPVPLVVLSGHTHEAYDDTVGPVRLLGAPSTWYGIAHHGDRWQMHAGPAGARVVDLGADGRTVTTRLITA